ncbi:MAG TPA: PAS domain S-box protein, partial [Candidatus Dormibacteraeota bacterium]|nr:PAS domain S-box protein [Candidatus Dormibacteraeota bacterium]
MHKPLHILHLEDEPDFSNLVESLLAKEGVQAEVKLVGNKDQFEEALRKQEFDLILADYMLPAYDGLQALESAREKCPQIPFLLVSGTIGEQTAIESLKSGATDYILKVCPERLVPSIRRAIEEAEEKKQRRRVETELVRREKYFRTLTENALDIVTVVDRNGLFLYNSPSVERVLGYNPKDLAGRAVFEFIHPDDVERVRQAFAASLKTSEDSLTLELRFRHHNGTDRYLEIVGQNRLTDLEIAAVVINSRDVTDRKQAEQKLRESEKQYRLIFDGNPIPMWVFDQESLAFLEVNDAAVQHYGYSREDFLAMSLKDIRPSPDVPDMVEYLHKLVQLGPENKLGLAGVWRHRKKNGSLIDVEVKWSPISFKGRPASLTMANDITERRRLEHRDAALSKLGKSLSSATTADEAAVIIREVADELFAWDAFTLDLYSSETDLVQPVLNLDTNRKGERFIIPVAGRTSAPSAMARRVMTEGACLILREEPLQLPLDTFAIGDTSRPSASLILVPIRNRTRVIGKLSIQSYTLNAYTHQELNTLQALADHCGGALERIRAEHDLHESEMLFHSVWQNSVDGMRLTDENGTIVAVNEAFCKLVDLPRQALEGKPLTVIYADSESPERILQKYRQRFHERVIERQIERRLTLHNGNTVTLEDTNSF